MDYTTQLLLAIGANIIAWGLYIAIHKMDYLNGNQAIKEYKKGE